MPSARPSRLGTARSALLALAAIGAVASCSDDSAIGPGAVVEVRVVPDTLRVLLGQVDSLQAFPLDAAGAFLPNERVSWSSDQPLVVMVDSGVVTAMALGTATISATARGVSGTAVVLVDLPPTIAASADTVALATIANSGAPAQGTVAITNGGGSLLSQLTVDSVSYAAGATGWLSASLDQPIAPATLTLTATPGSTPVGTYSARVYVSDPQATNSPKVITALLSLTAGPAANLTLQAGDNQAAQAGSAVPIAPSVLVQDQFGNPVAGTAVTFAVASGGGTVTGGAAVSDSLGIAAVTSWTLGSSTGPNSLTATATGLTGSPVTFNATATAGPPGSIAVTAGTGQLATVNTAVPIAPAVTVLDQFTNPVPGASVTWTVTAGGGTVNCGAGNVASCSTTTNGLGVATVSAWILGTTAGTGNNTLGITTPGASGTSITASGTAGAVTQVTVFTGDGQTARPGVAVASAPAVTVRDQFNNPVCGATVVFASPSGGGSVSGGTATAVCGVSGAVATVGSWTLGITGTRTNGAYANSLTATSNAVVAAFSATAAYSFLNDVTPIFNSNGCGSGCHGYAFSYANIVGQPPVLFPACGTLVVASPAGSSSASFLYQKIIGTQPGGCGGQMPPPAGGLSAGQINIIRDWIDNSAQNN
jgi:hypothetical protein